MAFIDIKGRTVIIKETEYTEIEFTRVIPKERFREFASTVLHGNDCVYSKPLNKWFCPTAGIGWLVKQADGFFDEGELAGEEVGDLIAKAYGEEKKAKGKGGR